MILASMTQFRLKKCLMAMAREAPVAQANETQLAPPKKQKT